MFKKKSVLSDLHLFDRSYRRAFLLLSSQNALADALVVIWPVHLVLTYSQSFRTLLCFQQPDSGDGDVHEAITVTFMDSRVAIKTDKDLRWQPSLCSLLH